MWKDTPSKLIEEYIVMDYTQHENWDGSIYDASGYIENPRLGYLKWRPTTT